MLRSLVSFACAFLLIGSGAAVSQDDFPNRPIRVYISFAPGGTTDISSRALAQIVSEILGVPFVMENRPGAGGVVAPGLLMDAVPDGYTLSTLTTAPASTLYWTADLGYNPAEDFDHIARYTVFHFPLAVRADAPWETWEEFVEHARENPGTIRYGTAGELIQSHLAMVQMAEVEGIDIIHVPFGEGGAAAMQALLGGHIEATVVGDYASPLNAGNIRLLVETTSVPSALAPDTPTFADIYGFNAMDWFGIVAPKGVPEDRLEILREAFRQAIEDPRFAEAQRRIDQVAYYVGPDEWRDEIRRELERHREILISMDVIDRE